MIVSDLCKNIGDNCDGFPAKGIEQHSSQITISYGIDDFEN